MKKFLLADPRNLTYQSTVWNLMANGLNSVISVILLWIVTRICGTNDAGIFSLGFSTAQMMLTIGNFGMRNYQATDISNRYSQKIYIASRYLTSFLMLVITGAFILIQGYTSEKAIMIILLCILKVIDALDDVFGGYYQRMNRLDISGKIMTFRIVGYTVVFSCSLLISHNMYLATIVALVTSSLLLIWMVVLVRERFPDITPTFDLRRVWRLLIECIPLCVGAFLLVYMGNAPKYAIDSYMSNEVQAYYNYLFMPCFVINLFVGFVLQPILLKLSIMWKKQSYRAFIKICFMIYGITAVIAAGIVLAGRLWGCSILSVFYGVDLNAYRDVITILLVGGGMFAFASITQTILTVMRHQYSTLWGFVIANVLITVLAPLLVRRSGLCGAAWSYTIASGVLFMILIMCFIWHYKKDAE